MPDEFDNLYQLSDHPEAAKPALKLRPAALPDPSTIEPRSWLYGTQLLRGFVTVLVAPGGTGKSAYAMAVGIALASGRKFLGVHMFDRVNVAVLNLEDPLAELDRRTAAILMRHQIHREDIEGRLFLHSAEDGRVTMASIGDDGFSVQYPDENALVEQVRENNIGLLIVDPYAESHALEENSNPHMVAAAAAWRRLARACNCAVLLVHHVRKGAPGAGGKGDVDSARGAKSLTDSARVALLMSAMGDDDGEALGVEPEERWQYVRLDNAKANLAPRGGRATWLKLDQVALGNISDRYPNGDQVVAVAAWEPTNVLNATPVVDLNHALDLIDAGPKTGGLYSPSRRGGSSNWAGQVLIEALGFTETQSSNTIKTWLSNGLLFEEEFTASNRMKRKGVRVNQSKRPE